MIARALATLGLVAGCSSPDPAHVEPKVRSLPPDAGSLPQGPSPAPPMPERERPADAETWARVPPPGFVDLRAAIPELCLDIRYATPNNFTGAMLPGYETPGAWLRRDAAAALAQAQASLRAHGVGLLVYDAYRPRRATKAMVAWARAAGRTDLLEQGFIAEHSAHARGRTIDVGLCDLLTREPLDLGTGFDAFVPQARHGAVSGEAGERRTMLRNALEAVGFSAYAREWWHYAWSPTSNEPAGAALDVPYGEGEPTPPG